MRAEFPIKSKKGIEYDLLDALGRNPFIIVAGDDICAVAKSEIERLRAKLAEAEKLVRAADEIRSAQKSYMADRGNEAKGKAVGAASAAYDNLRAAAEWMEKCE